MKNHRRSRHYKLKAPAGAYSDRYGPRLIGLRPVTDCRATALPRPSPAGPMLHGFPLFGISPLTILDNDPSLIRRGR